MSITDSQPRLPFIKKWMMFTGLGMMVLSGVIFWFAKSRGNTYRQPVVTTLDQQIASEVAEMIEDRLKKLAGDHQIVQQYGTLNSLKLTNIQRQAFRRLGYAPGSSPACLKLSMACEFKQYPCVITVVVTKAGEDMPPSLVEQPKDFWMEPDATRLDTKRLEPVLIWNRYANAEDLWLRDPQNGSSVRCYLSAQVVHPDFVP